MTVNFSEGFLPGFAICEIYTEIYFSCNGVYCGKKYSFGYINQK
jgi:hypothetical protein